MKPFASSCPIPCVYRHRGPFPILYDLNCVQRRLGNARVWKNIQNLPGQTPKVSFHLLQLKQGKTILSNFVSTQLHNQFVMAVRATTRIFKMTATRI